MYQPPGNRYEVERELARGGVGILYLAQDRNLERVVALKRVRREVSDYSEETEENLVKEARALSALQHPNVVTVYDVGIDDEGVYVVMEYVQGESLDQSIARGPLTLDDFRKVITQSLTGLHSAHQHGLIHRDLKPANLMVDWKEGDDYSIKLVDFGLVRFVDMPTVQTSAQASSVMGTIFFMAPEQFESKPVDVRTDLYSLGCVFYHCLTQGYAFDGETPAQIMSAHLGNRFERLGPQRPDLPHNVLVWVEKLISLDPNDRPASAKEALETFPDRAFVPHWAEIPPHIKPLTNPLKQKPPTEEVQTRKHSTKKRDLVRTTTSRRLPASEKATAAAEESPNPSSRPKPIGVALVVLACSLLLLTGVGTWYLLQQPLSPNEQAAMEELEKALGSVVEEQNQLLSQAIY